LRGEPQEGGFKNSGRTNEKHMGGFDLSGMGGGGGKRGGKKGAGARTRQYKKKPTYLVGSAGGKRTET